MARAGRHFSSRGLRQYAFGFEFTELWHSGHTPMNRTRCVMSSGRPEIDHGWRHLNDKLARIDIDEAKAAKYPCARGIPSRQWRAHQTVRPQDRKYEGPANSLVFYS